MPAGMMLEAGFLAEDARSSEMRFLQNVDSKQQLLINNICDALPNNL
jgi:hypothetical protein